MSFYDQLILVNGDRCKSRGVWGRLDNAGERNVADAVRVHSVTALVGVATEVRNDAVVAVEDLHYFIVVPEKAAPVGAVGMQADVTCF